MTWPFENDTSAITKKLANKSLKSEKRRNLMVVIAVALAAFLICFTGIVATSLTQMQRNQVVDTYEAVWMGVEENDIETLKGVPEFERVGKIVGGVNFYARKEIKDILAYLKTIDNGHDDLAVKRIINVPKRGIGATSINKVTDYALEKGIDFYTALRYVDEVPGMARSAGKIKPFVMFIQSLRARAEMDSVSQLIQAWRDAFSA